jgi:hypothetical protein
MFLVTINQKKVALKPMDRKPLNEAADAVIFVIATSLLEKGYQE